MSLILLRFCYLRKWLQMLNVPEESLYKWEKVMLSCFFLHILSTHSFTFYEHVVIGCVEKKTQKFDSCQKIKICVNNCGDVSNVLSKRILTPINVLTECRVFLDRLDICQLQPWHLSITASTCVIKLRTF